MTSKCAEFTGKCNKVGLREGRAIYTSLFLSCAASLWMNRPSELVRQWPKLPPRHPTRFGMWLLRPELVRVIDAGAMNDGHYWCFMWCVFGSSKCSSHAWSQHTRYTRTRFSTKGSSQKYFTANRSLMPFNLAAEAARRRFLITLPASKFANDGGSGVYTWVDYCGAACWVNGTCPYRRGECVYIYIIVHHICTQYTFARIYSYSTKFQCFPTCPSPSSPLVHFVNHFATIAWHMHRRII